jgi:transposase
MIVVVAFNFRAVDRDQLFLMPPSMAEWLPEDHLAWFVVDVVDELDLAAFDESYRLDGRGAAASAPSMMVAVWLYAYCVEEQSSRRIERRCVEDVAFRVVAANQQPDHCTIARFRQRHAEALSGLFAQVLACCAAAGLVRVDLVAVDGTKMRANASKDANRLRHELAQEVAGWLRDADDVDAAEDAQVDGSPREQTAREDRRQRIREALHQAQADTTSNQRVRRNVTDPDSRLMKGRQGFLQGYNGQAMATVDLVVIAAELSMNPIDRNELLPMIETANKTLEAANVDAKIGVVVADAGYWSQHNATAEVDCELLIATTTADKQAQGPHPGVAARIAADDKESIRDRAELDRRVDILERRDRGEITTEQASGELGLSLGRTYALLARFRAAGRAGLISRRHRPNGQRRVDRVRGHMRVKHAMNEKLATDRGRTLYGRRKAMIEPVFAQHKAVRGFDRFVCRGERMCATEWKLMNTTHHLLKLWRR